MRISFSTVFGVLFGSIVVYWGVRTATTNTKAFLDYGALLIVFGGTLTSTFIGFRWRYIFKALLSIPGIFIRQKISPATLRKEVQVIIGYSRRIAEGGARALDELSSDKKVDPFVRYTMGLLATGYSSEDVRRFSETFIEEDYFRGLQRPNILASMASSAPAFGMMGTLIGLIAMLEKLEDPSKMGPGLSVALMTTLYGVVAARFVFMPASTKVKQMLGITRFQRYLQLEGILLIQEKRSPLYIQDRLNSFLDPDFRFLSEADKGR